MHASIRAHILKGLLAHLGLQEEAQNSEEEEEEE